MSEDMVGAKPDVDQGSARPGGKYVYCIIRNDRQREFGEIGIGGGQQVYTIHEQDLAAVVSNTPLVIYEPTRENVLAHEFVNETVMREFTVIPMSFGTVFRSEEDVTGLLRSTYQTFSDVLEKMQGKLEFGLKILWDREKVVASIESENGEIHRLKDEITRNAASSTYFARMQLGRLVEAALEERGNRFISEIHEALKPVSVASRSSKVIGDRMILNSAFLVDRNDEKAFDESVKEISRRYEDLLTFKHTGPWPPYNFVNEARIVVASIDTYLKYSEAPGLTAPSSPPRELPGAADAELDRMRMENADLKRRVAQLEG